MRIAFEWEFNFTQSIKKLICKYRGHKWRKYHFFYAEDDFRSFLISSPTKECKRCGEYKYKKRKMLGITGFIKSDPNINPNDDTIIPETKTPDKPERAKNG